jgi:hypothetical protein
MTNNTDNFKSWSEEPENKKLLKENNIPLWVANQIWDAAKVAAANEYVSLLHEGVLVINPKRT